MFSPQRKDIWDDAYADTWIWSLHNVCYVPLNHIVFHKKYKKIKQMMLYTSMLMCVEASVDSTF